jgi:hypothetical protein
VKTSQGRTHDPGTGPSSQDAIVRLSVNLSPLAADTLKEYAGRKGISVTEAVRRAISILSYIDKAQERGASLNVEEAGAMKEIQFLC